MRESESTAVDDAPALFVDDSAQLATLCDQLRSGSYLALDTEFIRESTYFPQLCLIQVANDQVLACVDPLALDDLAPLLDILFDETILKVLHAGRQDLELFFNLAGRVPAPLFDTQIAAGLLGHDDQIGYGNLVQALLDISLDKSQARADWAERPVPAGRLRYAADDVRHLVHLYHRLREDLAARRRLDWALADAARLSDPGLYRSEPALAWRRVRGASRLNDVERRAVRRLAAWREEEAVRRNRPRGWILRDEAVIGMARAMPQNRGQLANVRGVSPNTVARRATVLLRILREAADGSMTEDDAGKRRPEPGEEANIASMLRLLRQRAAEADINPASIASRKELTRLALGERDLDVLRGWRYEIVGRDLLEICGAGPGTH